MSSIITIGQRPEIWREVPTWCNNYDLLS